MDNLFYYFGAGVLGIIIGYNMPRKSPHKFQIIIQKLNHIIMTQAEATQKIDELTTQAQKIKAEVLKLIDAVNNSGNVTPELETAINNAKAAIGEVDDLNEDETPPQE